MSKSWAGMQWQKKGAEKNAWSPRNMSCICLSFSCIYSVSRKCDQSRVQGLYSQNPPPLSAPRRAPAHLRGHPQPPTPAWGLRGGVGCSCTRGLTDVNHHQADQPSWKGEQKVCTRQSFYFQSRNRPVSLAVSKEFIHRKIPFDSTKGNRWEWRSTRNYIHEEWCYLPKT